MYTKGTVRHVGPIEALTENLTKRFIEVDEAGNIEPRMLAVEFFNERTVMGDTIQPGDLIKIGYTISSRRYEKDGKVSHFTTIKGYQLERLKTAAQLRAEDEAHPIFRTSDPQTEGDK